MPEGGSAGIELPYVEGLRLDEAMNPLTLLTVGMYDETLPNQDGAPVRLVIPVEIRIQEHQIAGAHSLRERSAADHVEYLERARIRFLFECESRRWIIRAGRKPPNAAWENSGGGPR